MKALSWKQPYAHLMLPPYNKIETRRWRTHYRGEILICTSKLMYSEQKILSVSGAKQCERVMDIVLDIPLITGHAIAVGELIDCRPMEIEDEDMAFVGFNDSLFSHIYKNVRLIEPIPWKGVQRFRDVTEAEQQLIKFI